jgi:hypothetical protein
VFSSSFERGNYRAIKEKAFFVCFECAGGPLHPGQTVPFGLLVELCEIPHRVCRLYRGYIDSTQGLFRGVGGHCAQLSLWLCPDVDW